jgi:hypothetical protein
MSIDAARDAYLATVDPRFQPVVAAIAEAVRSVRPDFESAIKYRILMYGLNGDFRRWICAIDATKHAAHLRFLQGTSLSDPGRILRRGTSTLCSMDIPTLQALDRKLVLDYLTEAVTIYEGHSQS